MVVGHDGALHAVRNLPWRSYVVGSDWTVAVVKLTGPCANCGKPDSAFPGGRPSGECDPRLCEACCDAASEARKASKQPAFNPRGKNVFQAFGYGVIDGTKFGIRWAWRYLFGSNDK